MSAANPTSGERDFEALRRAQRAHEPSMEEILASIRSIIADDREPPPPAKPAASAGPQIVYSNPAEPAGPPAAAPVSETSRAPQASGPTVVWDRADAAPVEAELEPEAASEYAEPLVSSRTDEAVAASFGVLSAGVALHNPEMIESLAREMLRPMLKSWLDDNLPSLVERLVRAEIQRVARGGR
jgi:uncharacterized protein